MAEKKNRVRRLEGCDGGEITRDQLEQSLKQMIRVLGEPQREYKDRIFRMLLKDRKTALEVYNAMNDTHYTDENALYLTTLENAVYMGMKNDVSFVIYSRLVLYEQQSTINPNMPLRDLIYIACIYSMLTMDSNIYGRKLIQIPEPRFVVFYNGIEKMPEKIELRLSDAYEKKNEDPALELKVQVVNINKGYNEKLMKNSPTLYGYMMFVECVRKYQRQYEFEIAIEKAIDECIENGILRDFLKKNRAEVLRMWLFEYDQEKHLKQERSEAETRGEISKLVSIIVKKMKKNQSPETIATVLEEELDTVLSIYNIAKQYAPEYDLEKIITQYLNEHSS